QDRTTLLVTSAFLWAKRDLADAGPPRDRPWLVFCSPPYAFYHERGADMLDLVHAIQSAAPPGSILIVEADEAFDFTRLTEGDASPKQARWDIRPYPPAIVGVWREARANT